MGLQSRLAALLVFFTAAAFAQDKTLSPVCEYKTYPIFAGGTSNEYVNCFIYDEEQDFILVGGNTTSEDFAPAANDHAYLYAVDLAGNWQWGKFFYNVSYAVSDISGCQWSSDKKSISIFGMGNGQPLLMDLNPQDASIGSFISFEWTATTEETTA